MPMHVTVIGIGNPYRHDDAAGLVVLAELQARFGGDPQVTLIELDGEPVGLMQSWEGSPSVLIIDAVRSLQPAGTIHRFGADELSGAAAEGISLGGGHLLGLGDSIDLARTLNRLPSTLEVFGIEGDDFSLGEGLSGPVERACGLAAQQVSDRIEELLGSRPPTAI